MQELNLSGNQLTGGIPVDFNNLTLLQTLDLSRNLLTNGIPLLAGLTQLKELNLSSNHLSGPIPNSLGELPQLQSLNLSTNHFTGEIFEFPKTSTLQTLAIQLNDLNFTPNSAPDGVANNIYVAAMTSQIAVTWLPQNAPSITANPQAESVPNGGPDPFSVTVEGAPPMSYQWQFKGANLSDGGRVNGSLTTTLSINPVQSLDQGAYQIVITNIYGSITSAPAMLTVNSGGIGPVITNPTTNLSITYGQPAAFSVVATGSTPILYQWFLNGTNLPGATTATFTITSANPSNAGAYSLVASNSFGTATNLAGTLSVSHALLTVTALNASRPYGATNPVFIGTIAGVQNGDNIMATYATTATTNSAVGTYPIVPTLLDPNGRLVNYTVTTNNGTLTVNQTVPTTTTLPVASPIIYGQTLASSTLSGGVESVPGVFSFPTPSTILNAGTFLQSVAFVPADSVDYMGTTSSVSLVVSRAALVVTANSITRPVLQTNPVFNGAITGIQNGDNIAATYGCSATASSPPGTYPIVPSLVDPNGRLVNYATTINTGTLTITAVPLQVLAAFNGTNGAYPVAALTQGNGGNFYGTTEGGGSSGYGTAFKVATNGALATLVSFAYTNGASPVANLTLGNDGNFYGTTDFDGTSGVGSFTNVQPQITHPQLGTVFRVSTNGVLTMLVSLPSSAAYGAYPMAGLTLGNDGNFYGTTESGGTNYWGTVFQVTTNGVLTTLVLLNGTNGGGPWAGLTLGNDGNFYGTTKLGGVYGDGTVFRVTTNGVLATLVSFNFTNGAYPVANLTLGNDGNFYGTTEEGGITSLNYGYGGGTVFQVTTNGVLTTLVSLNGTNGASPEAALTLGNDGNFYGTTKLGGVYGDGTVFRVTTNGVLTTLVSFYGTDGANPVAALTLGNDGNFYGTTEYGGTYGDGVIFKLSLSASTPAPIPLNIKMAGNAAVLTWNDPAAAFTLQSAPAVTGPFTNVPGATSPYTIPLTGARQFFRLIQ